MKAKEFAAMKPEELTAKIAALKADDASDIDADTFFSGAFFNEQSGAGILEQLKSMLDAIENKDEE